jgi:rhodanese-related sulfurtransferase
MEQIAAGTAPVVLDVRSKLEFDEGHVPGAVHVPFWLVGTRSRDFTWAPETPIVVYCGHGPRAYIAGAALRGRGFTQISYLKGHMTAWKDKGLPVHSRLGDK